MGEKIVIGIDAAANYFYNKEEQHYMFALEKAKISRESLITTYVEWAEKFHVVSVEDGLQEEDWEGWRLMNEKIGTRIMIIGDDLLVTNVKRLQKAIREKACNAVLIKPNQIGTVSETIACMDLAKKHMMKTIVSHRSGETADDFIRLDEEKGQEKKRKGFESKGDRGDEIKRETRQKDDEYEQDKSSRQYEFGFESVGQRFFLTGRKSQWMFEPPLHETLPVISFELENVELGFNWIDHCLSSI